MSGEGVLPDAPLRIQKLFAEGTAVRISIGRSAAHVYRISQNGRSRYLKTQPLAAQYPFAREVRALRWLQGKLPVPELLDYARGAEREYLLLSERPGQNCVDARKTLSDGRIVRLLAAGLRMIHAVAIETCPLDGRVDVKLRQARYNVTHHLVDEGDFDAARVGVVTGEEILQQLDRTRPPEDDLVFSHGDYCLPNILVQDNAVSGFVDVGWAGVADRYNDLAIASWSIGYNLGERYERLFFEAYGVDVDAEKIAYYRLLDELF